MPLTITPLTNTFCARITGVDLNAPLDDVFPAIRRALDDHLILVFPGQPMNDEQQVRFSEWFGPLEQPGKPNPGTGTYFARQSNIDINTGETIPPDDRRMNYQKGNMLWHADSTFRRVPSLCSILTAREVPPHGGATEFASTRAAYESLNDTQKAEIADLIVEHDIAYSRGLTGFKFNANESERMVPARHPLVQVNPETGRKSVLIGAHAKTIVGWPEDKARALLDDLLARATRPENTYAHEWKTGDIVIWDNRAAVHRATPYDTVKHRRLMQRTTISYPQAADAYPDFWATA